MVPAEVIRAESVAKSYSGSAVLSDISFTVRQGMSLSIIGPSGCGKTTLLYLIAGLSAPTSGSVFIGGKKVEGNTPETAFILQDFGLLPWKSVIDNVELGMKIKGMPREERRSSAEKLLDDLKISGHMERFPATLSGGEKQRVAIARALASKPGILLMDEPFSSLDTLTREKLQNTIRDIQLDKNLSMITVTHSIEEAVFLGDEILVMTSGPGRVRGIIRNSGRRSAGFRSSESFFRRCGRIRGIIGKE